VNEADLRLEVLSALREIAHDQEETAEILALNLEQIATRSGTTRDAVKSVLSDLLLEGLAEGFAETFTDRASDGHCRITVAGMAELRRLQ